MSSRLHIVCIGIVSSMLMLGAGPAWAQEWSQYLAFDDSFSIDFPGEPTIAKTTYKTEDGFSLPARVYTAKDEFGTYKITAVDWSPSAALHAAAYKDCMASTGDLRGGENPGICSEYRTRGELVGSTLHAAFTILQRSMNGKLMRFGTSPLDGVDGVGIELLNPDQSQTYAQIAWHEGYLYIAEATAPKEAPPPSAFPVSLQFLDKEGRRIRYGARYVPTMPVPQRTR